MDYFNFISCLILIILIGVEGSPDQRKLLKNLLNNYNVLERPVDNENDTLVVKIGLTLNSLNLKTAQSYVESNLWISLQWIYMNLRWNSTDYGGIKSLHIPPHRIWRPDILLYNSIHLQFDPTYQTNVVVNSDGKCSYICPGIHLTSCRFDIRYYPFDHQVCEFKFGSWSADGGMVDLQLSDNETKSGDLTSYLPNSQWELLEFPARINRIFYACCPEPYVDATFIIKLKRRGDQIFSGNTLALAVGAISTLLSLLLPPTSGHRITLGLTTVVIMYGLGNWINTNLGGEPNRMVFFFLTLALLSLISFIFNVIIIYFYNRNPTIHRMPNWLRRIMFDNISPILLLKRPSSHDDIFTSHPSTEMVAENRDHYEELVSDLETLVLKIKGQRTQTMLFLND